MKYATPKDVNYCIQILKLARDKVKGQYSEMTITPSVNRMILELEDMIKHDV